MTVRIVIGWMMRWQIDGAAAGVQVAVHLLLLPCHFLEVSWLEDEDGMDGAAPGTQCFLPITRLINHTQCRSTADPLRDANLG